MGVLSSALCKLKVERVGNIESPWIEERNGADVMEAERYGENKIPGGRQVIQEGAQGAVGDEISF